MRARKNISAIIICCCALALSACVSPTPYGAKTPDAGPAVRSLIKSKDYEEPARIAELEDRAIKESSGIVASRRNPGLFWTHNDSGDGPFIYAFDRSGKNRGVWRVSGAEAHDWEDIAAGPGPQAGASYLYLGDIGDNSAKRETITIYRVLEPAIDASSAGEGRFATDEAEAIRLRYPDGSHNAETLMVHPETGDLYIITKNFSTSAGVYKLAAPFKTNAVNTLTRLGSIGVPNLIGGLITGGDISPDGRRVILCDYLSAYELSLHESSANKFDDIWKQPMASVELGPRQQGEAVCYRLDGQAILATSEQRPTPLIEVKRKNK